MYVYVHEIRRVYTCVAKTSELISLLFFFPFLCLKGREEKRKKIREIRRRKREKT